MSGLLGRALAMMLEETKANRRSGRYAVSPAHLLLALLEEPSAPLHDWVEQQHAANPAFREALAEWQAQHEGEPERQASALEDTTLAAGLQASVDALIEDNRDDQDSPPEADLPASEEEAQ